MPLQSLYPVVSLCDGPLVSNLLFKSEFHAERMKNDKFSERNDEVGFKNLFLLGRRPSRRLIDTSLLEYCNQGPAVTVYI